MERDPAIKGALSSLFIHFSRPGLICHFHYPIFHFLELCRLLIHLLFSGGLDFLHFHFHFLFYLGCYLFNYPFTVVRWITYSFIYLLLWSGEVLIYSFLLSLILARSSFIYSNPVPLPLGITGFHPIEGNCSFI